MCISTKGSFTCSGKSRYRHPCLHPAPPPILVELAKTVLHWASLGFKLYENLKQCPVWAVFSHQRKRNTVSCRWVTKKTRLSAGSWYFLSFAIQGNFKKTSEEDPSWLKGPASHPERWQRESYVLPHRVLCMASRGCLTTQEPVRAGCSRIPELPISRPWY